MSRIHRVVCAVSGGVDSAVSAYLLKQRGFEVTGIFMNNWDHTNEIGYCTVDSDREYARYVCDSLDIPFHEVNFVKEYWTEVFSQMINGYDSGVTPNPDVLCNKHIKFGHLYNHAIHTLKADALATGHYARNTYGTYLENNRTEDAGLLKAIDQSKDQTLFLSQITQKALRKTMFPVGETLKCRVKEIASEIGLKKVVKKKESMGICFIGSRHFKEFIEEYLEPKPGHFIDVDSNRVVGTHNGIHYWTIGQRAMISGLDKAFFVVRRDRSSQNIFVAKGTNHPALFSHTFTTNEPHWIRSPPTGLHAGATQCQFRFQHTHPVAPCDVRQLSDGTLDIALHTPYRAITPGQHAVFYRGEECLGSAEIQNVGPSLCQSSATVGAIS